MQKISQRVLMQECIESMEKVAAPQGVSSNLLYQILGNAPRVMKNRAGANISPAKALGEILNSGNKKVNDKFISDTVGTFKKKLNAQAAEKAKSKALEESDLLSETGKALVKGKDLGGSAGTGAAIGAAAGALQDTDEESTNMLGATQKRKGKFTDRLKNMAVGAAVGAAGGAGLKAKSIAKKNIDADIKAKAKSIDVTKGMSNDAVLQKAYDSLAAGEYSDDVMQHLEKAYSNYMKGLPKADNKAFIDSLEPMLKDIRGLEPGKSGVLERLMDSLLGRKAKRNAVANDYNRALNIFLQNSNDPDAVNQFRTFMSGYNSPREAFLNMAKGKKGDMSQQTLDDIAQIMRALNDPSQSSTISKYFQNRARPATIPFRETPLYDPEWSYNIRNALGFKSPGNLDDTFREFLGNANAFAQ